MTTYQLLPDLTDDEYADLKADIRKHGVQIPIIVDPAGNVIDGHHRQRAADELKIACPSRTVRGTVEEFRSMALRLNVHRRSLTREQKRELLAVSIKADPQLSDRQHGERVGVHHTTVGSARERLESTGEISQSETRVSADGRERPATQPIKLTETTKVETYIDPGTGEIVAPTQLPTAPREPGPADAIAEAMRAPSVVMGRTIARLEPVIQAGQSFDMDEAISDLGAGQEVNAANWLATLEIAIPLLETWRGALRRRNLRSVK